MDDMIEAIRAAVTSGATAEQKATGAQACRTILTALEAEAGKPIALPGAPAPSPLAGLSPDQMLDLVIARLRALVANDKNATTAPASAPAAQPLRFTLIQPPVRPSSATRTAPARRRSP